MFANRILHNVRNVNQSMANMFANKNHPLFKELISIARKTIKAALYPKIITPEQLNPIEFIHPHQSVNIGFLRHINK
ncbi:hypothetical protein [Desulfobacula sp.]|uniref:hypothetical protein n=1 Tax=Desulfobacula sp. TaxID=2593537 RepID=UPI002714B476|nr:hypothetical protein [Desulfobacula sp.]